MEDHNYYQIPLQTNTLHVNHYTETSAESNNIHEYHDDYSIRHDHSYALEQNVVTTIKANKSNTSKDEQKPDMQKNQHDVITSSSTHASEKSIANMNACCCSSSDAAHYFNIPDNIISSRQSLEINVIPASTIFDNILRSCHRFAQNSLGDGNCYFRCLSLHLFGIEDFHVHIRQRIVSFMIENLQSFQGIIISRNNQYSVDQYFSNMLQTDGSLSSWATEIEIEATATMLQVPVYVLCKFGNNICWQKFLPRFVLPSPLFIFTPYITLLNTGTHYLLVRPSATLCNCLCEPPILNGNTGTHSIHIEDDDQQPSVKKLKVDNKERKFQSTHTKASSECSNPNVSTGKAMFRSSSSKKLPKTNMKSEAESKFLSAIQEGPNSICGSCKKMFYESSTSVHIIKPSWRLILKDLVSDDQNKITLCARCLKPLKQNKLPPLCIHNQLKVAETPQQLKTLNIAEQKMISLAHAYMKLVILPYGQKAINGQVINFPYDVQEQVQKFSHRGLVLVRTAGQKKGEIPKEYIIDTNKVIEALSWLKLNNHLYSKINLDDFQCKESMPPVIQISNNELHSINNDQTSKNEGWLPETSVVHKDPTLPKIDYSKFIDDRNIPIHDISKNVNSPLNMFSDEYVEQMAFPALFPDGINGLRSLRKMKLTVLQYFQSRLLSCDTRWQQNLSYLFWATNLTEKQKLFEGISIAARIRSSRNSKRKGVLTAGQVRESILRNPDYPEHFYGFMKSIRGSAAYWNASKLDLLALINARGPMTWFMTLSANDMNWDDLMSVLLQQSGKPNNKSDIAKLSRTQKKDLMVANPITTAKHFIRRVHHLIHSYILSNEHPLGKVIDYFWRIEFQMRGSPHVHSLWWIEGAPDLDTPEGRKAAPDFIDKYITTKIPQDDSFMKKRVLALQQHSHTHTCKKYSKDGNTKTESQACRFGFPQPVSSQTIIKNVEDMRKSPHCYVIKREPGAEYINPYNEDILRVWNANMDIQLVGSVYGAARYVCSYICKPESDEVSKAVREAVTKLPPDSTSRKQLSVIGNVFLTHRQLSAQEASFKMCGLPLRGASRQSVFINTRPEEERSRLVIPKKELQNLDDQSEDIFCSNVFVRYSNRPETPEFESMTLYQFATSYTTCNENQNAIQLSNGTGFIKKKSHDTVIRTPKFTVEQDGDKYYYSLLLLYLPWRNEKDLLQGFETAKAAFEAIHDRLLIPEGSKYAREIEVAIKQIQSYEDSVMRNYIGPAVAPNVEALDNDVQDPSDVIKDDPENINFINIPQELELGDDTSMIQSDVEAISSGLDDDKELNYISFTRLADHQYLDKISSLNTEQRKAFEIVRTYLIELQRYKNGQTEEEPDPIHLFVSGPGGTGKSHLIELFRELAVRSSLNSITHDSPAVVTMAPTGMAAYNVQGLTIHRALNLPVQHGKSPKYVPLKGERLALLRKQWRNTNTVIIDEISMVSYDTLTHIHRRLNDIKAVNDDSFFGGLNVITLGDFYQLPPVSPGRFIFTGTDERIHLWRDIFYMIELTQNMRQKDDFQYAQLLLRLRTAQHTDDDINLLATRLMEHENKTNISKQSSDDILHLYPTIKSCDRYNNLMLQHLSTVSVVHSIKAQHSTVQKSNISQSTSHQIQLQNLIPEDDRECAGLAKELHLCVGAVVMLCRNINLGDGLVNGARGIVTGFIWQNGISASNSNGECMPEKVLVRFFDPNVGKELKTHTGDDSVAIQPVIAEFYAKGKLNTVLLRKQFPLCLSWAATIHKVQGITLSSAFVDIGLDVFCQGMAYVALSRVKSLSGLSLLGLHKNAIQCSQNVEEEMQRLRSRSLDGFSSLEKNVNEE